MPQSTAASIEREAPISALGCVSDDSFAMIRRRMILECCKWDPQVGDVSTLAPFAISISHETWNQLAMWAEALTQETMAAEEELLKRPELHARLGIPARVRTVLQGPASHTPAAARTIRYDFHWTLDGWRISEANTDVPGGFTEASSFSQLIAEHYPDAEPAGDPASAWANSLADHCGQTPVIALLSAPGFMEDQQIMAYLAKLLAARGIDTCTAQPAHIHWCNGHASLESAFYRGNLGAIVRFYQAEWIARLPKRIGWEHFFTGASTPVANPASAILTESKRFPLVWDQLSTNLSTWRQLLPQTCDPRDIPRTDGSWLLKTAICNTGDTVSSRDLLDNKHWRAVCRDVWWRPNSWIAQRRFDSVPINTPLGLMHLCIGVYTVDGKAAGSYGRLSPKQVIDFASIDVAILVSSTAGVP
jgi:glutathionylspermidine synthase